MPPEFPTISDQSLPPQNIEAEESILGGILLDPEAIARVAETLTPEAFYLQAHQTIYRAAIALYEQKKPTDLMTISTWLADQELLDKVGGKAKLAQLADRTVSAVNIDGYAQLVLDKYLRRQLINAGHKIVQLGFDTTEGLNLVLDRAEQSIFQITQDRPQSGLIPLSETLLETFDQIEGLYYEDQLPGINTGFYDLDSMTSGLQPSDLLILAGRPSMGKCLGKGTKVVMFDGTLKAVENIQVNDQLMGPDSKPRKVLSLARGREMMYWVCQKRGVDYRVNESHILSLKASGSEGRRVHGEVVNMSVQDYLTKSQKFQQRHKGYKVAIDFPPQIVPIDPYLLGLWLGDGKLGDSRIFNIADEVIAELGVIAVREGYRLSHQPNGDRCDSWNLCAGENPEGFKIQLRRAQLLDQKWIPLCYLANTKAVRLELLAGLMDSDGYYCKDMQCFENTQKSKKLAEQIKFLADSLGFRTSIIRKQGSIKTSNFCGEYWRVRVSGNLEIIPTRIQYKKARNYASGRDWQVTGITIEPDGVDDYYGFELDGDGLFLLEDMTVTHNTAFGLNIARNIAGKYQLPVALFSLEMSKEQLSQRLLASEAKIESNRLRSGRLSGQDYQKLSDAIGTLSAIPIYIDDTATLTVMEMRSQARRLQAEQGQLGLVLLDYLQLMEGGGDNRVQELSRITRSLKTLAREIKAPVIALSQLSRGVEQRTNKRPMLSDLRESGCLTGDSLVTIADTGEEVPIKDLVGHSGFNVFALNLETWKLEKAPVSKVFSTGVKPTLELTTALGRKIIATGNHKFLTLDQGWVRLDELKEGDYIANPRKIPQEAKTQEIELSEAALLGHLIGDGCTLPRHAIQYTSKEKELADIVVELTLQIFSDKINPRIVKERQWYQVYLPSSERLTHGKRNPITEWLDSLSIFGLRSSEKFVPQLIFQQPQEIIATFLRHLWSTDGCLKLVGGKPERPVAYYTSSSIKLAKNVQSLLLRLGINARISSSLQRTGRQQYNVTLTGQTRLRSFLDQIGAVGQYKQNSLNEIKNYLENSTSNPNQDVIPNLIWDKYAFAAMKRIQMTHRQMQQAMGNNYCGSTFYKPNLSRERAIRLGKVINSPEVLRLGTSDVYWDKITSITPTGESSPVYDLTVPKLHNFVANNIIVHNSIEQDADLVLMLYRDAYYNPDTPDRDLAEVIITKHRNGPTGTVKLLFNAELTEFRNLARNE